MPKNQLQLAVLSGDGIGPEVIDQAIKVLDSVAHRYDLAFTYEHADVGAIAIDRHGDPLPAATLDICRQSDAVLFGAIGHPRFDNDPSATVRPEQGLLRLRKELGLFANLRPVTSYAGLEALSPLRPERIEGIDFVIVRELTGGIYFGERGRSADRKAAFDTCSYSEVEIERIVDLAFREASARRQQLTLVDKANVLETSRLWREVTQRLAKNYPDVTVDYLFVDNAAMQLILNPAQFDVVVTGNMFGDILSDESSVLVGSLGLLPSASVGDKVGMFEPIHGSFPQAAGKDVANPMATILSAAMLLDHLGHRDPAAEIRRAVTFLLTQKVGTADLQPEIQIGCAETGDLIAHLVEEGIDEDVSLEKIRQRVSTII